MVAVVVNICLICIAFLFTCSPTHAQRGEFYGMTTDGEIIGTRLNVISFELNVGEFLYYGKTFNSITIYRNGVIGVGAEVLNECPPSFFETLFSTALYIAPFWLPYTNGEVKYQITTPDQADSNVDFDRITNEYSTAFGKTLKKDDIDRAIVVTWNLMQNIDNQPRTQTNDNSFQLVLVILKNKQAIALFIYRVLNYDRIFNLIQNAITGAKCNQLSLVGLGDNNRLNSFPISFQRFSYRPARVASYSNINNFSLLGRYIFDLSIVATSQPFPPTLNCNVPDPDPSTCGLTTIPGQSPQTKRRKRDINHNIEKRSYEEWQMTTTQRPTDNPTIIEGLTMRAAKEFCIFRKAGQYPHPLFCNLFMYCGVSGSRADVKACPTGLNYNLVFGVCDWKSYLECNVPPGVNVIVPGGFETPEPQVTLTNNTCLFNGWGDYPDVTSCDHFLSCTNTRTIRQKCPAELYFRITGEGTGYCDWKRDVKCVDGRRTTLVLPS